MKATAIIGAAFGDEGKGAMTNFIAAQQGKNALVIRHSGGAQAGHTVVMPEHRRHVFHHFGSGTFQDSPTYLSRFFVCNPMLFAKELHDLGKMLQSPPKVYVDPSCLVTTPYDIFINQEVEKQRGNGRHGSCGIGFGETIERIERNGGSLLAHMLGQEGKVSSVLDIIRYEWLPKRLGESGIQLSKERLAFIRDNKIKEKFKENFLNDCLLFSEYTQIRNESLLRDFDYVIFEGAQGLLLDQESQFFPHVTRSYTGLTNILSLMPPEVTELDVIYVIRSYTTRHGAGPLPFELGKPPYPLVKDATNIDGDFQGSLRFSYLNCDLIRNAIKKDLSRVPSHIKINPRLAITCVDQLSNEPKFIVNDMVCTASGLNTFLSQIEENIGIPIRFRGMGEGKIEGGEYGTSS